MARHLPAVLHGKNGRKPMTPGRDALGRFVGGASPGPGRPANPFARYQVELRRALLAEVTPADVRAILRQVIHLAKRGSLQATELLLKWTLGAPPTPVDADRVDEHELSVRRGLPTLVDWLALADEQADREPATREPAEADDGDDGEGPLDPLAPTLGAIVGWALRQWAEAQTPAPSVAPQDRRPQDPQAGWDAFAASYLEWDASAAVAVDQLYVSYARWCAAHGEPVWAEERVLAWLTAHSASVHTGALSQVTTVQGVRVVA